MIEKIKAYFNFVDLLDVSSEGIQHIQLVSSIKTEKQLIDAIYISQNDEIYVCVTDVKTEDIHNIKLKNMSDYIIEAIYNQINKQYKQIYYGILS